MGLILVVRHFTEVVEVLKGVVEEEVGSMVVMEGGEGAAATPSHRMPAW